MYISLQRTGKSHSFNTTGETVNSWFTKDTRASSRADDFYSISKDAYRIIQLLDLTDELDEKQWLAEMYLYLNDNEMEKIFREVAFKNITCSSFNVIIEHINHSYNPHLRHTLPHLMPDWGSKYSPSCSLSSAHTHT